MTRRRWLGGASGVVGAGVLVACGGATSTAPALDTSKQVTLRMAARTDQQAAGFWQGVAGEMNQRFGHLRVELEQYPGNQYVTKIVALSAGGTQPDILEYSDTPFFEAAHQGLFLALDPLLQRDRRGLNVEDFFPA